MGSEFDRSKRIGEINMKRKLILASASPRRRELLTAAGIEFEIIPSDAEEIKAGIPAEELAVRNAEAKALGVYNVSKEKGAYILGADTIVVIDGEILGKPRDKDDAMRMLTKLNGRTHTVITGWCIVHPGGDIESHNDISFVRFRESGREALINYIDTLEPMDKAGSYGIQGAGRDLVAGISGDLNNIIGLPTSAINRAKELIG